MKNSDKVFIGVCVGMPFSLIGMATGSLFAFVFNKFVGSDTNGKKLKRTKRAK